MNQVKEVTTTTETKVSKKTIAVVMKSSFGSPNRFPQIFQWIKQAENHVKGAVFNIFGIGSNCPSFFEGAIDLLVLERGVLAPTWGKNIPTIQLDYPWRCITRISNKVTPDRVVFHCEGSFAYVKANDFHYLHSDFQEIGHQITCKKEQFVKGNPSNLGVPVVFRHRNKEDYIVLGYDVLNSLIAPNSKYSLDTQENEGIRPLVGDKYSRELIKSMLCLE